MTASLEWFTFKGTNHLVGAPPPTEVSQGYERVLSWAEDAIARPHDRSSSDLLYLECRSMAELLHRITHEEGNTHFLAGVLKAMLLETARRNSQSTEGNTP